MAVKCGLSLFYCDRFDQTKQYPNLAKCRDQLALMLAQPLALKDTLNLARSNSLKIVSEERSHLETLIRA